MRRGGGRWYYYNAISATRYRGRSRRPLNLEAMYSDIDASSSGDCERGREGGRAAWLMGMSFRESTRI